MDVVALFFAHIKHGQITERDDFSSYLYNVFLARNLLFSFLKQAGKQNIYASHKQTKAINSTGASE